MHVDCEMCVVKFSAAKFEKGIIDILSPLHTKSILFLAGTRIRESVGIASQKFPVS